MAADELFQQIVKDGWNGLEEWKAAKHPEAYQLEFKGRGYKSTTKQLDDFDRANIGKAVSGFANSEGGVLVIGVVTTKDKDGVDRVSSLDPSTSLAGYTEAINRHLHQCTDPRVPRAHAVGVPKAPDSDEGVVAIYVPASDGGPHRAKVAAGESDKYFGRQGTQTFVLENSWLAAMFGRLPPPKLELHVERQSTTQFTFYAANVGRGAARRTRVRIAFLGRDAVTLITPAEAGAWPVDAMALGWDSDEADGWRQINLWSPRVGIRTYAAVHDELLYPDDHVRVARINFGRAFGVLHVTVRIDCEGAAPVKVSSFVNAVTTMGTSHRLENSAPTIVDL
jgi:hypothetical protein